MPAIRALNFFQIVIPVQKLREGGVEVDNGNFGIERDFFCIGGQFPQDIRFDGGEVGGGGIDPVDHDSGLPEFARQLDEKLSDFHSQQKNGVAGADVFDIVAEQFADITPAGAQFGKGFDDPAAQTCGVPRKAKGGMIFKRGEELEYPQLVYAKVNPQLQIIAIKLSAHQGIKTPSGVGFSPTVLPAKYASNTSRAIPAAADDVPFSNTTAIATSGFSAGA